MSYELEPTQQIYGNKSFLTHNIKGDVPENDRHLFGMRIPSFGIIDFGAIKQNQTKSFKPIDHGITSDIQLISVYAFTTSPTTDEVTLNLLSNGILIASQRIMNTEMPYQYPPGAIINPNLTIQVKPRYHTTALRLNWQPVHVLDYAFV